MKIPFAVVSARSLSAGALAVSLLLSSCATPPAPPVEQKKQAFKMHDWRGDSVPGKASVVIYLDKQKALFYRDDRIVGWTYVATGISSHPTPTGSFKILEKVVDKHSNLYGKLLDAEGKVVDGDFDTRKKPVPEGHTFSPSHMPLFMRMTNDGVGMHVGRIPRPGRVASHGCIRLPRLMAQKFFSNVQIGTPVEVRAETPPELADLNLDAPPKPAKKKWSLFGRSEN
ncbi:hypothetical protein FEM03_17155 [Phragmitibacter flavus]|uniref:L,D-TPase catalytic domain-containing protein n=1 Tax=Phragmitibacter flavus TaxID=2576071 RepID=A0A5R8KBI3_9BACT|nr:hypothetical protein FEM03_17155 [Phragmitibacter flavus]